MGSPTTARDPRADARTSAHDPAHPAPGAWADGQDGRASGVFVSEMEPSLVCDRWHLGSELARGGMARVHGALVDPRSALLSPGLPANDAVIKVLDRTPLHGERVHDLFERSARIMERLAHPGVARVLGFERRASRSLLVMERLRGGTLFERVKRHGPLVGAAFDALARALLEAVAHVHDRGYLHGDLTPGNVMFRSDGDARPVLVDFDGVSEEGEGALESLVMTPGYSAPEQRAGEVSLATDLYGVGATLVYAATGTSPDRLGRMGRAMELELGEARISPRARALLQKLVALDPRQRPKRAREAIELLDEPAVRSTRSASRLLVAAVVVAVASTLIAAGAATMSRRTPEPTPTGIGQPTERGPARG
jgi:serine/threonine protein kinase